VDECVQRAADAQQDNQAERAPCGGTAGERSRLPGRTKRENLKPFGDPPSQFTERLSCRASPPALPISDDEDSRRERYLRQRDDGGDRIMLPIYRADVGSGQDRTSDKEVVHYLEATVIRVIPGPGVIESGDQDSIFVLGRLLTRRCDRHLRMVA
jgi:hypothetical protein